MTDQSERQAIDDRPRRFWPLFFLVFILSLAALSLWLHMERSRQLGKAQAVRRQFAALRSVSRVEQVKAQRSRFYFSRYYLDCARKNSYAIADFIRRLSAIIQLPLRVFDLQIAPGWQNVRFELAVGMAAGEWAPTRIPFTDFYQRLTAFPDINQAAFTEKDFIFQVTGHLEME